MKYITKNEKDIIKQLSDLKSHLDIVIDQLKSGQRYVLTKSPLIADLLILCGMEDVETVYNDDNELKYYCRFPLWF